jgi:hypothetical protein
MSTDPFHEFDSRQWTRREFFAAAVVAAASPTAFGAAADRRTLRGYPDHQSYKPGDTLRLHTSIEFDKFDLSIDRVGKDRKRVHEAKGIAGKAWPIPANSSSKGCDWPAGVEIPIGDDWRTGYYEADISASLGRTSSERKSTKIPFVVRSEKPGKDTKILLQLSTNTDNAYNTWGGHSLYAYNSRNKEQGRRVSSHRPMPWGPYKRWEAPFVRWAETHGYRLDYAVNNDLELHPEILDRYNLILSVGHDEYWSTAMRDSLEGFVARGGNAAFFGGNVACWQVRAEEAGSALVCYKEYFKEDPLYQPDGPNPLLSTLWSHHLLDRPENRMTGVGALHGGFHKSHGQYMDGSGAFTAHRPEHWIFAGAGMKAGAEFGGKHSVVGYECDGCEFELKDGLPHPTGRDGTPENFQILASAPAKWGPEATLLWYDKWPKDQQGAACLGLYTKEGGGTVFTAGTTDWSHGLQGKPDPVVDRVTRNVMDKLSKRA